MATIVIEDNLAGATLAAAVRASVESTTWSQAKRLIESRHVLLNGELCLDAARRLKLGDALEVLHKPQSLPTALRENLVIPHFDDHVVVVEKPSGINTVRHPAERDWTARRRELAPTLEDRLQKAIAEKLRRTYGRVPALRKVHRLDKLTSGLVVFARSPLAERELGRQFHDHTVDRRYLAIVPGKVQPQTIRSSLVRDRGDRRRGSSPSPDVGKVAITHIEHVESLGQYSLVTCRLETGRTHQIRIHLAELGHPLCGDPVYRNDANGRPIEDKSDAPRLALHALELGFAHPATGERLHWTMPLPADLRAFIAKIRRKRPEN